MHALLVEQAVIIARKLGFPLAITEMVTDNDTGEIPDCIAFKGGGDSLLIECKTSRANLLVDRKKIFRIYPEIGMGMFRLMLLGPDMKEVKTYVPIQITSNT